VADEREDGQNRGERVERSRGLMVVGSKEGDGGRRRVGYDGITEP
jgi:hypothetical protein